MTRHVSKNALIRSAAVFAILTAIGTAPALADQRGRQQENENTVKAYQDLSSSVDDSTSRVRNSASENATTRNGDMTYSSETFSAPGVFTLQNQTGQNDAGSNGTNIAAQINADDSPAPSFRPTSFRRDNDDTRTENVVKASQRMESSVTGSKASVSNTAGQGRQWHDFDRRSRGSDNAAASRTGDVRYNSTTFSAPGIYTLQNNTGNNVAASNGTNIAAQLNGDQLNLDGQYTNVILARQDLSSQVSGSGAYVHNVTSDGSASHHTGDVSYVSATFSAPGVYTLSNNTGLNNASSNGTNIAAQLNGASVVNGLGNLISP